MKSNRLYRRIVSCITIVYLLTSCAKEGLLFENPTPEQTAIVFQNTITSSNEVNILDYPYFYNGGGVAIGDINADGLPDIYFAGNQVKNKLYLNKGNLKFEDITEAAGVAGNSSWNTGAIMGDVNGDGLLDIYVCAVVGINGFYGFNELYINNGNATFTESAADYGLDFDTYSSSAAFLDFDLDGDLDLYLLNHAVHTQESYGNAETRKKRNFQTGDKLLRNDEGKFVDISEQAGIFGGANGYGLGLAISDFNQDGYADIFIGNDFHEDDYYYLNNGNGTFTESLRKYFGHTSRFSMGNDVADINHDGWPDFISLDMLPKDEKVLKSSEGADDYQTQRLRTEQFGYHYQYSRNMLYLNQPGTLYAEIAIQSGVSATDWSWCPLFGDYDQDGEQDLFVSNGIVKRPNDLDYINFVSNDQIKNKISKTRLVDQQALKMMPSGAVANYIFKGSGNLTFEDMSGKWITNDTLISGATALADLDLDGDLDIITSNSGQPATLYINKTNERANYLKIKFDYRKGNNFGIGTKIFSYHKGILQYKEMYPVRGFQSSSEPFVHFGYGLEEKIDSLKIIWPDRTYQVIKNVKANQTLNISPKDTKPFDFKSLDHKNKSIFTLTKNNLGINFEHVEDRYTDFNRQKLIPYQISDRGPATAVGDLNDDGKEDIFFGGSKHIPSKIFIQKDTTFSTVDFPEITNDSIKEDVSALIADFNSDGKSDLFVGSGGGDFFDSAKPLLDTYYTSIDSGFKGTEIPKSFENASVIRANDFDGDGDLDVFVGNHAITNNFGKLPNSLLLRNDNGVFNKIDNPALQNAGMITDAIWHDFDNDAIKDLIVVGEWMSPKFFKNDKQKLTEVFPMQQELNGLWQVILPFDIDDDGDLDLVLGNWGGNTKFKASPHNPLSMLYADFDENGITETILSIAKDGKYYPLEDFNSLSSQIISLRKKFTRYKDFAGKSVDEIFEKQLLDKATIYYVHELSSGFLENNVGKFSFVPFQNELQVAPIIALCSFDFDGDQKEELLVAGNYFGIKPYHGRFGSFAGALIKNKNNISLGHKIGLDFANKSIRHLEIITFHQNPYLLAVFNNDKVQVYSINR